MSTGSRRITVRESDVDFSTYALKTDAVPLIEGKGIDLTKMNFVAPLQHKAEYADIYKLAYEMASRRCRENPELSLALEAINISTQMIEEREQAMASRVNKVAALPAARSIPRDVPSPEALTLDAIFAAADAMDEPVWPSANVARPEPPAEAGDWLSIPGLGPQPQPPSVAVKFQSQGRDLVLFGHGVYLNMAVDQDKLETVVLIYDMRWQGGKTNAAYLQKCYAFPKSGACQLSVADVVGGQISLQDVSEFSVAPMIWAMNLGDLGLIAFFADESSS